MWQREGDAPASDRLVAERIAAGDEDAFALAYDRYADLLYGSLLRFTGDREVTAEIVQDAFMALWRRAHQFDERAGTLAGWLLAIARHRAVDVHRAQVRRPRLAGGEDDDSLRPALDDSNLGDDPHAVAARRWLQAVVRTAVSELPDDERTVLTLAYSSGLSQSEISASTGLPLGTVKSRTRRAMAHLRTRLADWPGLLDESGVQAARAGD
jgi:RNA polymerase sigma-70 factor (ECF subfamily)